MRFYVMGMKTPDFASADNPAANSSHFMTRTLTFLFLPVFNFYLMIFPRLLSFDWYVNNTRVDSYCWEESAVMQVFRTKYLQTWFCSVLSDLCCLPRDTHRSMESIPLISSLLDSRNLLTLAFYSSLIMLSTRLVVKRVTHLGRLDSMSRNRRTPSSSSMSSLSCASCAWHSSFLHNSKKNHRHFKNQWNNCVNNNNTNVSTNNNVVCTCPSQDLLWFKSHSSAKLFTDREESEVTSSTCSSSSDDVSLLSLVLLVIPFIPAANVFFYVGFVVAGELHLNRILFTHSSQFDSMYHFFLTAVHTFAPSFPFCFFCSLDSRKEQMSLFFILLFPHVILIYAFLRLISFEFTHKHWVMYHFFLTIGCPQNESCTFLPWDSVFWWRTECKFWWSVKRVDSSLQRLWFHYQYYWYCYSLSEHLSEISIGKTRRTSTCLELPLIHPKVMILHQG